MTELDIQIQVADYLRLRYPNVLFHSDYGSGLRLTPGQAVKQKRLQGGRRAWPDLFIAHPMGKYHGMYLELKKDGTRLQKRNGDFASEHIKEQWEMLGALTLRGYRAEFACGFDEAKKIIDEYLGGLIKEEVEF